MRKKQILYGILELVFLAGVPLGLILAQYSTIGNSTEAVGFRIGLTGIVLAIIVFLVLKRVWINRRMDSLRSQIDHLRSDLKIENDAGKIANIEAALKGLRTAETLLNAVLPVLLFVVVIVACKALEAQLVKLSGTVGLILISYLIGTAFSVLAARCVESKHKEQDNG